VTPVFAFDPVLLSRVEDAGLNASAPPQQRWLDGWMVRLCPGKAKRARCVNALAVGRLPFEDKLAMVQEAYREAGLPLIVRITPFSCPADLDERLAAAGFRVLDDTRVMLRSTALAALPAVALPAGCRLQPMEAEAFAELVGGLRGSPDAQRRAHAKRLRLSPVAYQGFALQRDGETLACGQFAREGRLAGLYDVFTAPAHRGRGYAAALCTALLLQAGRDGAEQAYLQVEGDNAAARAVYRRLGFADAYAYHYRTNDPDAK
jgi:ribosomal protein S18 acetylase RimI-like enzyme